MLKLHAPWPNGQTKIFILTDSSKFKTCGVATQFDARDVNVVITDKGIPDDKSAFLVKNDVRLDIVV